jgi:TolB protein
VLSKDGNSQIYSVNADGSGCNASPNRPASTPSRATRRTAIHLLHLRPRRQPADLPRRHRWRCAQRVTFEGSYNVSPRPSPDGKSLAFITRREGRFQLAVMDLASRQVQVLTDSNKDESPSFAPNSRMILIATEIGGRGVLSAVSSDGRIKQRLSVAAGDVREPAWGPFFQ